MSLPLEKSIIYYFPSNKKRSSTIALILSNEIKSRIFLSLTTKEIITFPDHLNTESQTDIYLLISEDGSYFNKESTSEAYAIYTKNSSLFIEGKSERGLLFGIGRFLREVYMGLKQEYEIPLKQNLSIGKDIFIVTSPKFPIRGHQIAYRPKTNSYDSFSFIQMKQEIIDCALWGCNTIEMIPHALDDCQQSPHFQETWLNMINKVSGFCDEIDLKVSIWYPAYFQDYTNPETMNQAKNHWNQVFSSLKRLDQLFVPGGDPGGRDPKLLFEIVEIQAEYMRKNFFPSAEVWVSSQFGLAISSDLNLKPWNPKDYEERFHEILRISNTSTWLNGVVYGPWTANSIESFKEKIPENFLLRNYPDLCHSLKCEFPVQNWDLSFAMTQTRECINPRPRAFLKIMNDQAPLSNGAGCYSEGVSDDVNKVIWSAFHWGIDEKGTLQTQETLIQDVLVQYGKVHFKSEIASLIKDLIYSLEQNWVEDPLESPSILKTFEICNKIESLVSTRDYRNWRLQMLLFRGYHDVFISQRRKEERMLEKIAISILEQDINHEDVKIPINNTLDLINNKAFSNTTILNSYINHQWPGKEFLSQAKNQKAVIPNIMLLISRLNSLAGALYQGIGLELSVPWHGGLHSERGAFFDLAWLPLSDLHFINRELTEIKNLIVNNQEKEKLLKEFFSSLSKRDSVYYYSFGDNLVANRNNEPFLIVGNIKKEFSSFREIGEDPTYWHTPLLDYADTNSTVILGLIAEGKVKRSWLSWTTSIWPTLPSFTLAIPIEKIKDYHLKKTLTLEITYIGKDLWVEGGDWIDFNRLSEPTRLLLNDVQIHDYWEMTEETKTFRFELNEKVIKQGYLHLKFEAKNGENITIRTPLLPIAEINIFEKKFFFN